MHQYKLEFNGIGDVFDDANMKVFQNRIQKFIPQLVKVILSALLFLKYRTMIDLHHPIMST